MRRGRLAFTVGLLLASSLPAHAWMTYVGRDVATGARIGLGANADNDDGDPTLAVLCTPDGLTATFDTGIAMTDSTDLGKMSVPLAIAADGGEYDPFPVAAEAHTIGEQLEIRLRFSAEEALGLTEYVLGAQTSIQVSYRFDGEELVYASFSNDSAAVTLGAVLAECAGRGETKNKG